MSQNESNLSENEDIVTSEAEESSKSPVTWEELGLVDVLCKACEQLKWKEPSKIQKEAIPIALQGKDIIGLAETGSTIGVKCVVIVGGMDMMSQALILAKKPHILIATPGRLLDHLENTKGFNLRALKYLVMDEADRILNMDFEVEVDKLLKLRVAKKVKKLQRACLQDPVKIEVSTKYQTVEKLLQYYVFIPVKFKDVYLVHILNEMAGNSFMIFCSTCNNTIRTALMLRNLGLTAVPLHGQMSQNKRLAALTKFKAKNRSILISTDVARGLDIPHVDVVINFDIPTHSKDYIHRVGRTARAGRSGKAITFVTQYDVELYQRIEQLIGKQLPLYKMEEDEVMVLQEREIKDLTDKKGKRKKVAGMMMMTPKMPQVSGKRLKGKGGFKKKERKK
ncbi:hypothetical protein NQ317_018521 [Molorchus minor]|uniref:RNA helicase n=1 Tax=Molorchus minor TaxID=1323400 RepID=A0ABQ9IWV5_9CUCU|nr:hypothetical protein NQ317_018521 [Molorchus minor]